jgi:DNA-3-methyladenine glycosylase
LSNPDVPSFLNHPVILKREFYTRPVLTVAKELLGKIFVVSLPHAPAVSVTSCDPSTGSFIKSPLRISHSSLAGKIVEVEAYNGSVDQAAHTFIGRTKRNEIMFRQGGYLYVYFTYGVHFCANVVTGIEGKGTAVLIRALEPLLGIEQMIKNRYSRDLKNEKEKLNLTNGPGKICKALNINRDHYGADLTGNQIFIIDQPVVNKKNIVVSKRIGISKSIDLPWRFYIKGNPWVSVK